MVRKHLVIMETILQVCLTFFIGGIVFIFGFITFMPHMIIPIVVKCLTAISPFKKKWILLDNKMWCSYLEKGSVEDCTDSILVLHGFSGSAVDFIKYGSYLDKSTHLIFLNLLNHGDTASFTRDVEMKDMLEYIHEFIEKSDLKHCKFHMVGYSLGGFLSVNYVSQHPERISSLILINPAGMHELTGINLPANGNLYFKSNADLIKLIDIVSSGTLPPMPSLILTALRHHKNNTYVREGYVLRGVLKGLIEISVLQNLAGVKVMYVQGELDRVTPKKGLEHFLEHVPHADYHVIKDGSHLMTYTHDKEMCMLINDWLQKASKDDCIKES